MFENVKVTPRELQAMYREEGININARLRQDGGHGAGDESIIETSYDIQAGSYVGFMQNAFFTARKNGYARAMQRIIHSLCRPESILEAGVGEATTFSGILRDLEMDPRRAFGFDLSWSRVACAREWLKSKGLEGATLCTGSLQNIPFADGSIDVVYTCHTLEPNHGQEVPYLRELYRVAGRYLILLEPAYEFASPEVRQRMDSLGYCRDLKGIAESLGYKVLDHALFPFRLKRRNPTAITVIEKATTFNPPEYTLACPKYKTRLERMGDAYFSPEALAAYPILAGIPCLRVENGIMACMYPESGRIGRQST